jgi:hypothetical protein
MLVYAGMQAVVVSWRKTAVHSRTTNSIEGECGQATSQQIASSCGSCGFKDDGVGEILFLFDWSCCAWPFRRLWLLVKLRRPNGGIGTGMTNLQLVLVTGLTGMHANAVLECSRVCCAVSKVTLLAVPGGGPSLKHQIVLSWK